MSEPEEIKPIESEVTDQPTVEDYEDDDTPEVMLKPDSKPIDEDEDSNDYDPEEQDTYNPESLSEDESKGTEPPVAEPTVAEPTAAEPIVAEPKSSTGEIVSTESVPTSTADAPETQSTEMSNPVASEAAYSEPTEPLNEAYEPSEEISTPSFLPSKPSLPLKPAVEATTKVDGFASKAPNEQLYILRTAYEEIFSNETAKDPNFSGLSPLEQLKIIMPLLEERNITFNTGTKYSDASDVNFDQVYSFNKPYRNLKDPVPLIPINELCRRPNITAQMTPEEDEAYSTFIKVEAEYMRSQNWDEFPDKLRLFIGNLPANTISKQDLFRIFSQYGDVVQIAIKAGYGFAQFRSAESCLTCIKGETHVPLHNKIMRLDASKPQKSKRPTDSREFKDKDDKRSRRNIPECQIYTTGKSSVFFIRKVKRAIQNVQVTNDVEDITHRDVSEVISEAAYSGVLGTCVIKESKVDVQTFETTPDGGIKFDEYSDIEPEVAAEILQKAKVKKYGANLPAYQKPYEEQSGGNDYRSGNDFRGNNRRGYGGRGGGRGGDRGGRDDRRGGFQRNNYDDYNKPYGQQSYDQGYNRGNEPGNQYGNNYGNQNQYGNNYGNNQYGNNYGNGQYGNNYGNGNGNGNGQYGNNQYGNNQYGNNYGNNQYGNSGNQYGNSNQYGNASQYGNANQYDNTNQYGNSNQYGGSNYGNSNKFNNEPAKGADQTQLLQTLQNMDPASMQNMLTLLQQKQQQHGASQAPSQPINYGQPSSSGSRQETSKDNSKNELMETLARLSRK